MHRLLLGLALVGCGGASTPGPALPSQHTPAAAAPEPTLFGSILPRFDGGSGPAPCTEPEVVRFAGRAFASPIDRVSGWLRFSRTCRFEWRHQSKLEPAGVRAYMALATALADAGYPQDCRGLLAPLITPYPGGAQSIADSPEDGELVEDLLAVETHCDQANERRLAVFKPAGCPASPGVTACFDLVGGGRTEDGEVTCPAIEQTSDGAERVLRATAGPLASDDICCGLALVTTTVQGGRRYLRVAATDAPHRECHGGTAAADPSAIYKIDGDALVLVSDESLWLN